MTSLVELLVYGLQVGAVYALLGFGISLIFSTSHVLNLAHGALFATGTVLVWLVGVSWDLPMWAVIASVVVCVGVLGVILERIAVRPLLDRAGFGWLLTTLGAGMMIEWVLERAVEGRARPVSFYWEIGAWNFGDASIDPYRSVVLAGIVTVLLAAALLLKRSRYGQALVAVALDAEAAALRGIHVRRVRTAAFVLASLAAGAAGLLMAPYTFADPHAGLALALKGFIAAVIGGLAGTRIAVGALVGGLLLGTLEELATAAFGIGYRDTVVVLILMAVLLVRPQGIFGVRERAA